MLHALFAVCYASEQRFNLTNLEILRLPMSKPSFDFSVPILSRHLGKLMVVGLLFAVGCQGEPEVSTSDSGAKGQQSSKDKDAKDEFDKAELDKVVAKYEPMVEVWVKKYREVASRAERTELIKSSPYESFGKALLTLYEENMDKEGASAILEKATSVGSRQSKSEASKKLFELAAEQDTAASESSYAAVARYGTGELKNKSLRILLDRAKSADDESDACRYLSQMFPYVGRAQQDIAAEAGEFFWNKVQADLEAESAAEMLGLLGKHCTGEVKENAYEALLVHHPDSEELSLFVENVPRTPSRISEKILQTVCKNDDDAVRMKAAVALSSYYRNRDTYRGFWGDLDEAGIEQVGRSVYDYVMQPEDPSEMETVNSLLNSEFDVDDDLLAKIEEEKFIIKNFSIGSQALEIEGKDLDGEAFRLSDYKGKVVFLDFWGDW